MKLKSMSIVMLLAGLVIACQPGQANVPTVTRWKPAYTTEVFKAPAPANMAERETAFTQINSPENIEKLAKSFFSLILLDNTSPEVVAAWKKGDYQGALDAYRDFFLQRFRFPPPNFPLEHLALMGKPDIPVNPGAHIFLDFLATGDELLQNTAVYAMVDKDKQKANVRVNFGVPGRINWTWCPPGYTTAEPTFTPTNEAFASMVLGSHYFFNSLLKSYLETRDKAYLLHWAAVRDDRYLNWERDTLQAGLKINRPWGSLDFSTLGIMAYLSRTVPDFSRDLPAGTLARLLLELWRTQAPLDIRGMRQAYGNRRIAMFRCPLYMVAGSFPEFLPAQYCLRECRRIQESYVVDTTLLDGSDLEWSRGYFWCYGRNIAREFTLLLWSSSWNDWLTPEWVDELKESFCHRTTWWLHQMSNDGHLPGVRPPSAGKQTENELRATCFRVSPESFLVPDNARIFSALFGDGSKGPPSFTSEAMPYRGCYTLRTGWGRQDLYAFMHSPRDLTAADNNGLILYAHGIYMLCADWDSPLWVDGIPQADESCYDRLYPEMFQKNGIEPPCGMKSVFLSLRRPLKNRWHTSDYFDVCEGTYEGPFHRRFFDLVPGTVIFNLPDTFITDVSHQRQILLLRQPGLWLVTDRLVSTNRHDYRLDWPIVGPRKFDNYEQPGYSDKQVELDAARGLIRTCNPAIANLSIHTFSPARLTLKKQLNHANALLASCAFAGQPGTNLVISALYPRRTIKDELAECNPVMAAESAGCDVKLTDGTRVLYRAALGQAPLQAEDLRAEAEMLALILAPDGSRRGVALGCRRLLVGRKQVEIPSADFEFTLPDSKSSVSSRQPSAISFIPIYRPMDPVEFSPQADCFTDALDVTLSCTEPDADIRYTLDCSEPDGSSPLYAGPIRLNTTTTIKARAFRKGVTRVPSALSGTEVTAVTRAQYTKKPYYEPLDVSAMVMTQGVNCAYYEGDFWMSTLMLATLTPARTGPVKDLLDLSFRKTTGKYGFVNSGYLEIPADGVYSFHAPFEFVWPGDSGYDLRFFLMFGEQGRGRWEEWYPGTRALNHGTWSVPLKKGKYAYRLEYVDQRPGADQWVYPEFKSTARVWNGEKPVIEISGPGLERQPIPARMLQIQTR